MKVKAGLLFTLAALFGGIFVLILVQIALFVIGDIKSGVLTGTPETGWGILISASFLAPVAVVSFLIFYFSNKKFRQLTQKPKWLMPVIAILAAILMVLAYITYDKLKPQPEPVNKNDYNTVRQLEEANTAISLQFRKEGELPNTLPPIKQGKVFDGYHIINKDTYELCGIFETDTTQGLYDRFDDDFINETNYAKMMGGEVLMGPLDADRLFNYHHKGEHCYRVKL